MCTAAIHNVGERENVFAWRETLSDQVLVELRPWLATATRLTNPRSSRTKGPGLRKLQEATLLTPTPSRSRRVSLTASFRLRLLDIVATPPSSESVVPVSIGLVCVTALVWVAVGYVLWTRHRRCLTHGSPRSVVLFFGVLFGTADCINNIVMLALGDEYPALIFYLSRLIYQPNPAVLYLSTVYRLLIMIIKPHVCRSLLWFSWTMTIVIQALGFTGFTVNYLAASGDPVLAARPLPVWSTLPSNTLGAAIALKATSGASHGQLQHQPQSQVSQGGPRSYPHPSMPASAHSSEPKSAASRPEWV